MKDSWINPASEDQHFSEIALYDAKMASVQATRSVYRRTFIE